MQPVPARSAHRLRLPLRLHPVLFRHRLPVLFRHLHRFLHWVIPALRLHHKDHLRHPVRKLEKHQFILSVGEVFRVQFQMFPAFIMIVNEPKMDIRFIID